jgi:2-dehydropantoate 2-reductase
MEKIAIIGTGAMGSVYAALMADSGLSIYAIDTWAEHVKAINSAGLRLEGASGDRTVNSITAATSLADIEPCDLYIIATKADGVADAAKLVSEHMRDDSLVLTIQNGLGAGERIAQHMDTGNVLLGVAEGFGASMKGPGHAHHNNMKQIRIGEMNGGETARLEALVALWRNAGFNANGFGDIHQLIWEKFLCNVFLSAPCTVFECQIKGILNNPANLNVALGCMREAYQAGKAKGINFSFDDPDAYAINFASAMPEANPSMRLDHLAKRPSEIDAINGMVPVVCAEEGLSAPYNETLAAIVRQKEANF